MKKYLTGFTLMELIIVIVIFGILAAIAIPNYTNVVEKQKLRICILNTRSIILAEKIYYYRNNEYWPEDAHSNSNLNEINSALKTLISDNDFTYRVANLTYAGYPEEDYFIEIWCRRWFRGHPYDMYVKWRPISNRTNWTYKPVSFALYWLDLFPDLIPEDNDPSA